MKKIIKQIMILTLTFMTSFLAMSNNQRVNAVVVGGMDSRFKDINFYTCVRSAVGESNVLSDGVTLKDSALKNLTTLHCYNKQLKNTKGLELLVNLTELRIGVGYINQGRTKITKIDLKNNTKLKSLTLDNNKLKSIDLSKNTKLENISLANNELTSVDFSKNTLATRIDCQSNKLTSVNVTKNKKLYNLTLDNNKLTSINLNNNNNLYTLGLTNNYFSVKPNKCNQVTNCQFGYIIKFNSNGGSSVRTQNLYSEAVLPTPTKQNHTFAGWYISSNLIGQSVRNPFNADEYPILDNMSNIIFYAKWIQGQYAQEAETTDGLNKTTIIIVVAVLLVACLLMISSKQSSKTTKNKRTTKPSTTRKTTGTKKSTKKKK